jgi:Holliday junction DNA helicase RuvB
VAEVRHDGRVTGDIARAGLAVFEVDELGLDRLDHAVLDAVIDKFSGGPVGLTTLAAAVGEEPDTVEDVVEPYLIQLGFIQRTPRGRLATERAYAHVDRTPRGRLPI